MPSDPHINDALRSLRRRTGQFRFEAAPAPEPLADAPAPGGLPPGRIVASTEGESAYVVREPVAGRSEQWDRLSEAIQSRLPLDTLFVDIETTGLSPSLPLFLIGTLSLREEGLVVRQFLARDYEEERAAISLYHDHAAGRSLVITFNGTTFDLPYIRTRAAANRLPATTPQEHWDLLPTARKTWGASLPDCKLQTLERHILGRTRQGDIPGSRVPEAYHEFVATGDPGEMVQILEHNFTDLVAMAELVDRLAQKGT